MDIESWSPAPVSTGSHRSRRTFSVSVPALALALVTTLMSTGLIVERGTCSVLSVAASADLLGKAARA